MLVSYCVSFSVIQKIVTLVCNDLFHYILHKNIFIWTIFHFCQVQMVWVVLFLLSWSFISKKGTSDNPPGISHRLP